MLDTVRDILWVKWVTVLFCSTVFEGVFLIALLEFSVFYLYIATITEH